MYRLNRAQWTTLACVALAAAFGAGWAAFVLGSVALDRHNLGWLWGDLAQVYLAWGHFLSDPDAGWLTTTRLSHPLPISVSLFDPMPVLLLLARPFAGLIGEQQQFFGYYFVVCLALQGAFGYLATRQALRLVGGDHEGLRNYTALLGGMIVASLPYTFFRFVGHTALSSQWVLVMSAWVTLATFDRGLRTWLMANGLVLLLATGLNPYLALLVLISNSVLVAVCGWRSRRVDAAIKIVVMALVAGAGLAVFGFMGASGAATGGYGTYSMNMLGPLDSNGLAGLLRLDVVDATGGQSFEGYMYLGMGVLLLGGGVFLSFVNYRARPSEFPFVAVMLVIASCYLLALSTRVTLSAHSVDVPMPAGVTYLLERFRGSGRLFWMGGFWLILMAISAAVLRFGQLRGAALVTLAFAIQLVDIVPIGHNVRTTIAQASVLELKIDALPKASGIFVYPAWQCDHEGTPGGVRNYEAVGRYALRNNIPTNNFYAARTTGEQSAYHCDFEKRLQVIDARAIYLLSPALYEQYGAGFSHGFDCSLGEGTERADVYWTCLPRAAL